MKHWYQRFRPHPNTVGFKEQFRGGVGALAGLLVTGGIAAMWGGVSPLLLVAPMGASAVLLFCVPASPLAQPWSVVGGNMLSAAVGVACARAFPDPVMAAGLAVSLAIASMFLLRCLHPPGGAVALSAVLGGPQVHAAGYGYALAPVGAESLLMVLIALIYNNLTGRRYPHLQQPAQVNVHATRDAAPTARLGFTPEDLDQVLKRYGQVLDVSRDDLESLFLQTEMHAYSRRFGLITCGDIMSADAITVEEGTRLDDAWRQMRAHKVHALPVLDADGWVRGIVSQNDFVHGLGMDDYGTLRRRLRRLLARKRGPQTVADIMTRSPVTARTDMAAVELVPLMANAGYHHIPVVDSYGRFAGMVTQSDLVASLYESRLA
ncbi:HPP family protein [Pseudoduganella sp. GCM10020061]|uniref:HPP family protein n=1 Tax=Pseudoduganella sp. GCM10020061 TaxID=3317345 RepID=UPI00363A54A9